MSSSVKKFIRLVLYNQTIDSDAIHVPVRNIKFIGTLAAQSRLEVSVLAMPGLLGTYNYQVIPEFPDLRCVEVGIFEFSLTCVTDKFLAIGPQPRRVCDETATFHGVERPATGVLLSLRDRRHAK